MDGLPDPSVFYHVHSYVPHPADEADVLGVSDYGGRVRERRRPRQRLRRAVPSREVLDPRPRAAAQLRRAVRQGGGRPRAR